MISFFLNALSESDSWSMRWKDQTQWIEMISFFLMLEVNQTDFNILWPAFGLLMKILTHFDFSQGSKYPRLDLVSMFRHNQSCRKVPRITGRRPTLFNGLNGVESIV